MSLEDPPIPQIYVHFSAPDIMFAPNFLGLTRSSAGQSRYHTINSMEKPIEP
jgi:hypothetical protein